MTEEKKPNIYEESEEYKTRQAIIKAHCDNQQCDGCPAQFQECAEAEAEEEARQEEIAYCENDDPYDGEDFDY